MKRKSKTEKPTTAKRTTTAKVKRPTPLRAGTTLYFGGLAAEKRRLVRTRPADISSRARRAERPWMVVGGVNRSVHWGPMSAAVMRDLLRGGTYTTTPRASV